MVKEPDYRELFEPFETLANAPSFFEMNRSGSEVGKHPQHLKELTTHRYRHDTAPEGNVGPAESQSSTYTPSPTQWKGRKMCGDGAASIGGWRPRPSLDSGALDLPPVSGRLGRWPRITSNALRLSLPSSRTILVPACRSPNQLRRALIVGVLDPGFHRIRSPQQPDCNA